MAFSPSAPRPPGNRAAIVARVASELAAAQHGAEYFEMQRPSYVRDLDVLSMLHPGGRLLELGSYPFYFSRCLDLAGFEVLSVDLDPARASEWIAAFGLNVVRCDIEQEPLPLPDGSVTTVSLAATFEHLRIDPLFVLRQIARVLRVGGILYLTTPNFYRLGNVARFLLGQGLSNDPIHEYEKLSSVGHMGHVREYTASELRALLHHTGFEVVSVTRHIVPSHRGRWVDLLHWALPRLRPELVVVARRRA